MSRKIIFPALLVAILGIFLWAVSGRVIAMITSGEPIMIALAIAGILIIALVGYAMAREWQLAFTVSAMARVLAERGELPEDTLPRSPGGRIDREAADAAFEQARIVTQQRPEYWGAWYNLAFAYDAAGDRKRARSTLRTAARLYRSSGD